MNTEFKIEIASMKHIGYAELICQTMETSALARGTGISKRLPTDIIHKMEAGKAFIATHRNGDWAGFGYFEVWDNGKSVSNSGLIVAPHYRNKGIAEALKRRLFRRCRQLFPHAKIFSITTTKTVMKINSRLGFKPMPFGDLTADIQYWKGCQSCCNYDILQRTNCKLCLCTGMVFDPAESLEQ
ncbi:GNAT family N-acetyltransferase [Cytophagaceae bacterium YF14B1]|uniref:GNAT family N-acetyltransferase n=1 Tax=Xanthocytophaga flava TaxID=3048013 RepID=A0AAE3U756_9BACT|nr:GNAT family N-acetyltransferase [Xanthocytophaga flavus]MDJ1479793.1 GNAT family N-acetyltransferase [Xanthocytophaga flavus]